MKQTIEEAAKEELNHSYANKYVGNGMFEYGQQAMINMFISEVLNGRKTKQSKFSLPYWRIGYMAVMRIVSLLSLRKN